MPPRSPGPPGGPGGGGGLLSHRPKPLKRFKTGFYWRTRMRRDILAAAPHPDTTSPSTRRRRAMGTSPTRRTATGQRRRPRRGCGVGESGDDGSEDEETDEAAEQEEEEDEDDWDEQGALEPEGQYSIERRNRAWWTLLRRGGREVELLSMMCAATAPPEGTIGEAEGGRAMYESYVEIKDND